MYVIKCILNIYVISTTAHLLEMSDLLWEYWIKLAAMDPSQWVNNVEIAFMSWRRYGIPIFRSYFFIRENKLLAPNIELVFFLAKHFSIANIKALANVRLANLVTSFIIETG